MSERITRRIEVFGRVQGVGFRPYVHRTAHALGLSGWVRNVDGHVELNVTGRPTALRELVTLIREQAPPLSAVRHVRITDTPDGSSEIGTGFAVRPSGTDSRGPGTPREIPPDAAICQACLTELFDPADRRYRYPFVNCTDCGPRATIIEGLPYDRDRTSMRDFPLCPACAAEYGDATDRRFHAEPLACPACGPRLAWDQLRGDDALQAAVDTIKAGGIVAVKGLGGYQLVCDATDVTAVAELRRRKRRPAKPLAVMVADLAAARLLAKVGRRAAAAMASAERPVVLVPARNRRTRTSLHPGTDRIGILLPTTGLHHLLCHALGRPLVVTSGNLSGGPIAIDDAEARTVLARVADGFLSHDRQIRARYDDSVVQAASDGIHVLRRARGLAPAPLPLPYTATVPVLGVGAQLKHTFTLAEGGRAHLAAHAGDLADETTYDSVLTSYATLTRLTGVAPQAVAHDLHPGYLSTQWARALPVEHRIPVQHHHAHVAAVAAEHGVRSSFIGVAYDGLGLGDDGTLWGGEILLADLAGYRRIGRFGYAPLPGGEAAVRHPWRMALGYLYGAEDLGSHALTPELTAAFVDRPGADAVRAMITQNVNCPRASSAGRLFDAVASLLGLGDSVSFEGQAALALESAASGVRRVPPLPWSLVRRDGLWVYDPAPTLTALLEAMTPRRADAQVPFLAAAFHATVAEVTAQLVDRAVAEGAPRLVCLGGGCFQNAGLRTEVRARLRPLGLRVLTGRTVPVNDGGISYGQAAVAAARLDLPHRKG
ncbi:carbamoyltransferase HypF [Streptomyces sp. SID8379]|uniref:carbamoyltransferase HypF n=1 Tax=unclassified Streptomyces TaxID=2593676 RepID=UPI0003656D32|nr:MULTISPECIES: carbamoyltransferase HypF [unclassified Streptomyces]MYW69824.1 carbamoyltransferase HypF [Streptomyces sp. SID8379]